MDSLHEKKRGYHPVHGYFPTSFVGKSGVIPNCIVHVEQVSLRREKTCILCQNSSEQVDAREKVFELSTFFGLLLGWLHRPLGTRRELLISRDIEGEIVRHREVGRLDDENGKGDG